jgi:hypothetical protein
MKPQKKKSFVSTRSGAEHAIAERNRGAGIHQDRRTKRQRTRASQKRAAIQEWS